MFNKAKQDLSNLPIAAILLLFALVCILPFWLVLSGSLTAEEDIMAYGYGLFPRNLDFTAYKILANDMSRILSGYKISLIVTVGGTILSVFVIALAAYPLSQERVKYHKFLNFFVLFTMLFTGGMVPWFIVCRNILHLTDSIWALILPYLANAWFIFLTRNYYRGIPIELVEAAKIDGAGEYRIFFRIMFPLAKPVIATISLFICLNYWNDWWLGIMLIDNVDMQPLQLLLRTITSNIQFLSSAGNVNAIAQASSTIPSEGIKMATCMATIGPIILVYPFVQKYFVKGIMVGAVKG
ncbi:carbohydrate ABC transporter permease [Kineothrix sp. MB12-C1]|uniref:carbohydrate ABC transporter permease n=1 Tax=Kineothrix sp. MB12-C1 TaxID=3070215 RepID=UPI0027D2D586|nr:carbohydrate ABC transporter permease [Kineothrix sp. MB12-C1]WMC91941.1 carbohydrate ABC transporter permease [Kineothrix sp. MB12-C1]